MKHRPRIYINGASVLSPLGTGLDEMRLRLETRERGLSFTHRFQDQLRLPLGEIDWRSIGIDNPEGQEADELLLTGARKVVGEQMKTLSRHKPERVGLFVGTTTSGVSGFFVMNRTRNSTELSVEQLMNPNMQQAILGFRLAEEFQICGPVYTFSTSCIASTQALMMAHDAIQMGWIDAAVVLGADVLNLTTLYGFEALQLLDHEYCRPFTQERAGINLGEAIVALRLEREADNSLGAILSFAALSEAHHMTQPFPGGEWMARCMSRALDKSGLKAQDIGYVNPHATGTLANDEAEMAAVQSIFGRRDLCHPTKTLSGHALGASGALEILLSLLDMQRLQVDYGLKNSFGFGGANLSVVLSQVVP